MGPPPRTHCRPVPQNPTGWHVLQGDEDPRREPLYKSDDKRNPGEQGYHNAKPASASLGRAAHTARDRGRLVVFAQRTPTVRPQAVRAPRLAVRPTLVRPSMAWKSSRFALV